MDVGLDGTRAAWQPSGSVLRLRHNLKVATADAGFYGGMVGCGENYLGAFAIAIGLGQLTAGLGSSLPILCGGVAQLLAMKFLRGLKSYRTWILGCVMVQAAAFVPLIVAAFAGSISVWTFYLASSLYWAGGMAAGPAWNAWISQIVPSGIRAHYFARRARWTQAATFLAFVVGGVILQSAGGGGRGAAVGFAAVFGVAIACRLVSAAFLASHRTDERIDTMQIDAVPASQAWRQLDRNSRCLIACLISLTGFIQISGPFFNPYLLAQLHYSYYGFVAVIAAAFVTRILSLRLWAHIATRYGTQHLVMISGVLIVPLAPLWIISSNIAWIIAVQCLAGFVWAGFELATMLIFFERVPLARRTQILTVYNVGNSVAWFCGAGIGGWVIASLNASPQAYHTVFVLSAVGRLLCVAWVGYSLHRSRPRKQFTDMEAVAVGYRATPAAPIDVRGAIVTSARKSA